MQNFILSPYVGSLYYADLFRISGKIWMIMGEGKTAAARIASKEVGSDELALDGVALAIQGGQLVGRFDLGGGEASADHTDSPFFLIDRIAYCLDERQTSEAPRSVSRTELHAVSANQMAYMAATKPFPGWGAKRAGMSEADYRKYEDRDRREAKFFELVTQANFRDFVFVPYMKTVADKAALYA
ncbi:hypothetical protein [Burkholderia sp. F1]|uniref:hypothetical protein n=1 Tax=Burkholderia sp. F1 TaxID=3366817 RepID=UPI003D72968D